MAAFTWLLFGKLVTVVLALCRRREVQRQKLLWGVSVMLYLAGVFATSLLPLPRLGCSSTWSPASSLPGKGLGSSTRTPSLRSALYFGAGGAQVAQRHRHGGAGLIPPAAPQAM